MHHCKTTSFPNGRKMHSLETQALKISQGTMYPDPSRGSGQFGPQFYWVPAYSHSSALLLQKLMKTLC